MTKDIGLKRGTVKVIPYNPKWTELFEKEKNLLKKTFGDEILAIEHIGSTAVPGLEAKPIIDIDIGTDSLKTALAMKEKFKKIGYEYRSKNSQTEELFVKGPEENRTFHAHVTVYGGDQWNNDIFFRDHLIKNPSKAQEYIKLKQELAKKYANDRAKYTAGKKEFIEDILKK